jgi:hypothetical protein
LQRDGFSCGDTHAFNSTGVRITNVTDTLTLLIRKGADCGHLFASFSPFTARAVVLTLGKRFSKIDPQLSPIY